MKADYIIRGGRVIDPASGTDEIRDVVVKNAWIEDPKGEAVECSPDRIIDASGCLVTPGLIDFHTHIFSCGSGLAIRPDMFIPLGVTSTVDAGTAGVANYEAFHKTIVENSSVRIKSYLTTYSGGQIDPKLTEDFDPSLVNYDRLERVVDKYRDEILGLKIRLSVGVCPVESKLDYVKALIEMTEKLNAKFGTHLGICVHTTNLIVPAGDFAEILRPGDIYCHCYQGMGNTILTEDGQIDPRVIDARKRGVIFDSSNGKANFGIATMKRSLEENFFPDVISSDSTIDKFNMPPYDKNLLAVMAKYRTLGMDLTEIIRAVTETPARIMQMEGKIGTLAQGAYADISIFKEEDVTFIQKDFKDEEITCDKLLVPQMTILGGEILYCQPDYYI